MTQNKERQPQAKTPAPAESRQVMRTKQGCIQRFEPPADRDGGREHLHPFRQDANRVHETAQHRDRDLEVLNVGARQARPDREIGQEDAQRPQANQQHNERDQHGRQADPGKGIIENQPLPPGKLQKG